MTYLSSKNINIYPLAKQRLSANQKWNRLTSEFNMVNIIRQLLPKNSQGFVIDWDSENIIKFNIGGYYVEANLSEVLSGTEVYAHLSIGDSGNNNLPEVIGQDESEGSNAGKYMGMSFDNSPKAEATYTLKILSYNEDTSKWDIPDESNYPFAADSFYITEINGNI